MKTDIRMYLAVGVFVVSTWAAGIALGAWLARWWPLVLP